MRPWLQVEGGDGLVGKKEGKGNNRFEGEASEFCVSHFEFELLTQAAAGGGWQVATTP